MKRIFQIVFNTVIIVLNIFWFTSCSNQDKNKLEYWSIGGSADLGYDPSSLFNQNSDLNFVTTSVPWTEHEKKILTSILSGNPPDVISEFAPLKSWASRSALIPLDQYIEESDFDTNQFFNPLWKEMRWDGKIYGIPINTVSYGFFYNKSIFEEVGIRHPPKTWSEVKEISRKINKVNKSGYLERVGYLPNYGNLKTSNIIAWQLDHKFINENGKVKFNSYELKRSFSWVKDFINEIGLERVLGLMGTFGTGPQHGFISGKVAMMILDSSYPEIIEKYNSSLDYGVAEIPIFGQSKSVSSAGIWWLGIPKGAKSPNSSWEFISFLSQEKNQIDYLEKTEESLFSANKNAALNDNQKELPFYHVFLEMLKKSKSPNILPLAHDKFWMEYHRAEERILRSDLSIESILEETESEVQRELKKAERYYKHVNS
ncbi:MAG: hypothetical protein CBE24_00050 [bacterium TMED264]|nr:MAG: hypothetical protein CBE24_00050 [bacterium TMED264]|tara:strand:+ start:187 stop:1473 length:1287 start_codon:yes stop_codon:yes gene_type:complete